MILGAITTLQIGIKLIKQRCFQRKLSKCEAWVGKYPARDRIYNSLLESRNQNFLPPPWLLESAKNQRQDKGKLGSLNVIAGNFLEANPIKTKVG